MTEIETFALTYAAGSQYANDYPGGPAALRNDLLEFSPFAVLPSSVATWAPSVVRVNKDGCFQNLVGWTASGEPVWISRFGYLIMNEDIGLSEREA